MISARVRPVLALVTFTALVSATAAHAGARDVGYEYLSPLPGARLVSPWNNIVLRPRGAVDPATVSAAGLAVTGATSGAHAGRFELARDGRSLVFTPDAPFAAGEVVTAALAAGIRTRDGAAVPPLAFTFTITTRDPRGSMPLVADEATGRLVPLDRLSGPERAAAPRMSAAATANDTLPPGVPNVTLMSSNQPDPGNLFIAPFSGAAPGGNLMIVDNAAQPMFYRHLGPTAFDFKMQPNGLLTYFSGNGFWGLDSSYAVVDSFRAGNGYTADVHDLQLLPNGNALLLVYDVEPVDMSLIVPGGDPNAHVVGLIVQELDPARNVVFQWRSWDHFQITDADTCLVSLRDSVVDYVHGNAVELDSDGNLLISSRAMGEITKIDHATGDIIWRLGLRAKNNQFAFPNDTRGFAGQHDIRRLPNGDITVFDNANCMSPVYSRGVEYRLDEVNKTATLVWEARNTPDTFTPFMGNVQRHANGGTTIGWGGTGPDPKLTDLHADGTLALSMGFGSPVLWTYRAFRFPWRTTRFALSADSLDLGTVEAGHADSATFSIHNTSAAPVTITSIVGVVAPFSLGTPLPITLAPGDSASVLVFFSPVVAGDYAPTFYVRSVGATELVAQSITVVGSCVANGISIDDVTQYEGNSGFTPFQFHVHLAAPRPTNVSVRYQTIDGTATVADTDYVAASGRLTIVAGDTAATITVNVVGNHVIEPDETFFVQLSNPSHTVIDRGRATGTILDDDRLAGVGDPSDPIAFALHASAPNPGRGDVAIRFDLPRACAVRLEVFDLAGRRVQSLVDGVLPAGHHEARWTPGSSAVGVFLYRMRAPGFEATRKLVRMR